jgi:hypothetical protein
MEMGSPVRRKLHRDVVVTWLMVVCWSTIQIPSHQALKFIVRETITISYQMIMHHDTLR